VERKRSGKDGFPCVLDGIGKATDELDDMHTIEGARCNQVGERESVEDWCK
jgi:hypothetical protein